MKQVLLCILLLIVWDALWFFICLKLLSYTPGPK